jgi:predicted ATP-grasp superfamily ATP-dependent carboligase
MRILIPETLLADNVLAAIRSLGRVGYYVTVATPDDSRGWRWVAKLRSRFVESAVFIQSPHVSPSGFVQDLLELVANQEFDVLLPFSHSSVLPISYNKELLSQHVHIPIAEYPILRRAHDKLETIRLAQGLDVPTPVTFHPKSRADLFALKEYLPFPCLVKARQGCGVGKTIRFAKNFEELVAGYDVINDQPSTPPVNDYSLPIIQEYVPGQIHDALFLYANGECKAALTQERVITYPVQGGPGAVNQTTHDPLLRELGQRLLDALGWHGPTQVEFRLDPRDGQYKLLEINPKLWGTLPLSLVAGIDFSRMACELAYHGDVEPNFNYRVDVYYRGLFSTELQTLVQDPTMERLKKFLLYFGKPDTHYGLDLKDPLPDLLKVMLSLRRLLFKRKEVLPARNDLNILATQRPPARQPALELALIKQSPSVDD